MPPRIPTSSAYWSLRAEQILDRVFNDDDNILKTVQVQVNPQTKQQESNKQFQPGLSWPQVSLAAIGLIAVLGSSGLVLHWRLTQQALQREANLALIDRLRRNPPAAGKNEQGRPDRQTPTKTAAQPLTAETATADELKITALPNASATQLEPITVPLPSEEVTGTTSKTDQGSAATPQPLLFGVVHAGNSEARPSFNSANSPSPLFPANRSVTVAGLCKASAPTVQ